jgi:hypothetical protein
MLHHNLPHFGLFVHPVVNVQVVDAVWQIGYVELYPSAYFHFFPDSQIFAVSFW